MHKITKLAFDYDNHSRSIGPTTGPIVVAAQRTRHHILKVHERLKPLQRRLLHDRQNPIINLTHKFRQAHKSARMGVNICSDRGSQVFVLNLDGVYEGECTSGDEEVGCDWGEVVVCTIEGELGGLECGGEGYFRI